MGMQGPSPGMATPEPLGLAVGGNERSECLSCCPLTREHSRPQDIPVTHCLLCARPYPKGFIHINSFNPHNTFFQIKNNLLMP